MSNYDKRMPCESGQCNYLYLIFIYNRTRKVTRCTSVLRTWELLHSRETNEHIYSNGTYYILDTTNCKNVQYHSFTLKISTKQ